MKSTHRDLNLFQGLRLESKKAERALTELFEGKGSPRIE